MGNPDPLLSAKDIRETFLKMAMNDEETVALVAGGHTFGKAHGAADPNAYVGAEPEGASLIEMGLGWTNSFGSGTGVDTITSGIEGAWTPTPTKWDMTYFDVLFGYEWALTESPAGAKQWQPIDLKPEDQAPTADGKDKTFIMMTTADMAMRMDPSYEVISRRFHADPAAFAEALAHGAGGTTLLPVLPMVKGKPAKLVPANFALEVEVPVAGAVVTDGGTPADGGSPKGGDLMPAADSAPGECFSVARYTLPLASPHRRFFCVI
jgi:catalase-peroxidase